MTENQSCTYNIIGRSGAACASKNDPFGCPSLSASPSPSNSPSQSAPPTNTGTATQSASPSHAPPAPPAAQAQGGVPAGYISGGATFGVALASAILAGVLTLVIVRRGGSGAYRAPWSGWRNPLAPPPPPSTPQYVVGESRAWWGSLKKRCVRVGCLRGELLAPLSGTLPDVAAFQRRGRAGEALPPAVAPSWPTHRWALRTERRSLAAEAQEKKLVQFSKRLFTVHHDGLPPFTLIEATLEGYGDLRRTPRQLALPLEFRCSGGCLPSELRSGRACGDRPLGHTAASGFRASINPAAYSLVA